MKQRNLNIILAIVIILMCFGNIFFFFNFINRSIYFPVASVILGIIIWTGIMILFSVFIIFLLYIIYKRKIRQKSLIFTVIILAVLLILLSFANLINSPIAGVKIFEFEGISINNTKIYGDYIAWLGDNHIYLLDISSENQTPINIGAASHGPIIHDDKIFFEDKNAIYAYSILTQNITVVTSADGILQEAFDKSLVLADNNSIAILNMSNGTRTTIHSGNITGPVSISGNYIVWKEFEDYLPENYWSEWTNERMYDYDNSGIYSIWYYNILSGQITKALPNVMQVLDNFSDQTFDIYENKIAYTQNLSIYIYDIIDGKTRKLVDHSKKNEILGITSQSGFPTEGYLYGIKIFNDKLLYREFLAIHDSYNGHKSIYVNITDMRNFEIDVHTYDIFENRIVGWKSVWKGIGKGYLLELHLINL